MAPVGNIIGDEQDSSSMDTRAQMIERQSLINRGRQPEVQPYSEVDR